MTLGRQIAPWLRLDTTLGSSSVDISQVGHCDLLCYFLPEVKKSFSSLKLPVLLGLF